MLFQYSCWQSEIVILFLLRINKSDLYICLGNINQIILQKDNETKLSYLSWHSGWGILGTDIKISF